MQPTDWLKCQSVRDRLARLEGELRRVVSVSDRATMDLALELVSRGGKRLRPALLFTTAEFGHAASAESLLAAGAALELMHVASLYHDDVIDRATTRRGGPSVNSHWGNAMATSGGTFLFARAIALLASLGDEVNLLTSRATVRLCAGQLLEVENAYNTDLSVAEHTEILARKTATLFELPCVLGAKLAGADPSQVAALVAYAHKLGLAFQIADDALDVAGDASVLGKTTLTDLREGIYSLPLILVLQQQVPGCAGETVRLRGILRQARLSESDLQEIVAALRRLGAVDMALEQARAYAREASDGLRELPYGPACESLALLADFAVSRSC